MVRGEAIIIEAFVSSNLVPTALKDDMDESQKSPIVKGRLADASSEKGGRIPYWRVKECVCSLTSMELHHSNNSHSS